MTSTRPDTASVSDGPSALSMACCLAAYVRTQQLGLLPRIKEGSKSDRIVRRSHPVRYFVFQDGSQDLQPGLPGQLFYLCLHLGPHLGYRHNFDIPQIRINPNRFALRSSRGVYIYRRKICAVHFKNKRPEIVGEMGTQHTLVFFNQFDRQPGIPLALYFP
jgi:hypothetical protein